MKKPIQYTLPYVKTNLQNWSEKKKQRTIVFSWKLSAVRVVPKTPDIWKNKGLKDY